MLAKQQANIIVGLSAILYYLLFYYVARYDSWQLIILYCLLFVGYLILVKNRQTLGFKWLLAVGLLFRVVSLFSIPALSDDFYRFIWDGRLWAAGINPFAGLPGEFLENPVLESKGINKELFNLLNSPTNYTVYPPIAQYINWLAAKLFSGSISNSVYLMRSFVIGFDMISLVLIYKILRRYQLQASLLVLYALNPLVIIELAGNLHHEVFMITFLLGFLLFYSANKSIYAAPLLALSVASKLLPLMFLPTILLKEKKGWLFMLLFGSTSLLLFYPFIDASFFSGMQHSLTLYYQNFEFNAGIYYLLRKIGFWIYGYNTIAFIGKALFIVSTVLIFYLSYYSFKNKQSYSVAFTIIYLAFVLLSLILHPWYILLLVAFTPFTKFKFPIVWSFFIFLTYLGYGQFEFLENYYVVTVEFIAVIIAIIYDLKSYALSSLNLKVAP